MVFVLTLIFGLFLIIECSNDEGRYLVYPPGLGNKVQFIVGIGVPVSNLPTIQSVTWGYVIKTNYVLPTNITEYGNVRSIRKRSTRISRWDFYQSIADVLNRSGLPGEQCIQRSICETARIKFARNDIIDPRVPEILKRCIMMLKSLVLTEERIALVYSVRVR